MGFAGQVFAARVAVGLAMPSPKAFSQAGQAIGGFASKMYANLNKSSISSASRTLATQKKNLAAANNALKDHTKKQGSMVEAGTNAQLARIKKLYGDVGKAAMASAGSMKGLKATMGSTKAAGKLFGNLSKDMKDAGDYAKMMKNFSKLSKDERAEVFATFEARKKAHSRLINTSKKREALGKEKVQQIRDEIAVLQSQEDEFKGFDKARNNADDKYNRKKKKHLSKQKEATEGVTKAQKELETQEKSQLQIQEHLIRSSNDMAVSMKSNFVDAVRESVSALTALYYKLEQNSSQLIEFERELMNANSVFRVTNDELFSVGNQVVQFGQEFGMEMQNGATGLYQLASAGLSAADAMTVLNDTLKLSMAVQGDHNTISKLVTQTLFGFEMEMNQAGLVADKFAYAIQKSLIEYQDLASAVKFALPFFTSTGQSIDQLLGALQVLTNRALEAGIAGRGLRQGVAELAESIGDATANFKKFGVEVVDAEGNMLQLTEIAANFHEVLDEGVINDTELLTSLIQDLNVRGATAFVHLVQASDEFTEAVEATANAGGELDEMIKIQNMSISSQIQILRNNIAMMSLYQDAAYEGTGYMNAFHEGVSKMTESLQGLLVTNINGTYVLTEFGKSLETFAIKGVKELQGILDNILPLAEKFLEVTKLGVEVLKVYLIPVKLIVKALQIMGPQMTKVVIAFHLFNKIVPITAALQYSLSLAMMNHSKVTATDTANMLNNTLVTNAHKNATITSLVVQKLVNTEMWKGIAVKIYDLTLGKLRLILENRIIATDTVGLAVTDAKIAGWFIRDRLQSKNILGLIWENILNIKKNTITAMSAAKESLLNAQMAIKLWLSKAAYPHLQAEYMLEFRKNFLRKMSIKQLIWKNILAIKENILTKIGNAQMAIKVALSKIAYGTDMKRLPLEFRKNFLAKMSIKQLIMKNILVTKEIIMEKVRNGIMAIKLALSKAAYGTDMKRLPLEFRKNFLRKMSITQLIQKIALQTYEHTVMKIKLALSYVIYGTDMKQFSLEFRQNFLRKMTISQLISKAFWQVIENVQTKISNAYKTIAAALTMKNIKAQWSEIFAKITGNSLSVAENIQMKENIFLRMWKSTETIRGTIAQAWNNVVHFLGNTLLLNGWILLTQTIPTKIYDTLVTTYNSIAKWWNTSVEGANTLAKIGNLAVTAAAVIVFILYALTTGIVTIATWAWNIALYANPVGLIVLGVIALIVAFVIFAVKINEQIDLWSIFGMIARHTLDMILWPFKVLGGIIMGVGNAVWAVLEGPLFKLGMFLSHFFKMLMYYVKLIGNWFMEKIINPVVAGFKWIYAIVKKWVIDPIVGFFIKTKELLETLKNPIFTLGEWLMKHIFDPVISAVTKIWKFIKKIVKGVKKVGGAFLGKVMDYLGFAEGGYVNPMSEGGRTRARGPYLVGEKGPELFMPQGPGKIIPNKDLNTQRVKNMLSKFEGDAGAIADKAFQRISSNISVDRLEVRKANMRGSRIGIDTFGGNI